MSAVIEANATEVQQLLGTAWGVARLLGATFTEKCWNNLSAELGAAIAAPAPVADEIAFSLDDATRRYLVHARVARLVARMYEEALRSTTTVKTNELIVLGEQTLISSLLDDLCIWPFWTKGC